MLDRKASPSTATAKSMETEKSKKPLSGTDVVGINSISHRAASARATTANEWFCTCLEKSHYGPYRAKTTGQTVCAAFPFFLRQTPATAICSEASLTPKWMSLEAIRLRNVYTLVLTEIRWVGRQHGRRNEIRGSVFYLRNPLLFSSLRSAFFLSSSL